MEINKKKKLVAGLSIISNILLTILKIFAGFITGSLSIISEAIHSISDFAASIITFISVLKSSHPADKDHPYGHGKYEDMAGFIEGIIIIFAGVFIIFKSTQKIQHGAPIEIENNIGITVMIIAIISNFVVSSLLFKVSKESNSISLYADGQHLRTDIYSSVGVMLGLILIKITGITLIDPIIAILVAAFICKTGYSIAKQSLMDLLDYSLPNDEIENIKEIINKYSSSVTLKENSIKARRVGPTKDIDFILQFKQETTICECHKICDKIEEQIQKIYRNSSISIHAEPICYEKNCQNNCCKSKI